MYFFIMCTKRVRLICSCVCLYLDLCMYICSLITLEWEGRLFPNFQDSSMMPRDGFRHRGQPCTTASRLGTGTHTHRYETHGWALGGEKRGGTGVGRLTPNFLRSSRVPWDGIRCKIGEP